MSTQKLKPTLSSDAGFTLIESLVAIVILSIMLVGVAPLIVLSTATRVQARRVEQATEAARTYLDGVRSGVIFPPNVVFQLDERDEANNNKFVSKRDDFSRVQPPAGSALASSCKPPTTAPTALKAENYPYCNNPKEPADAPTSSAAGSSAVSLYCIDRDGDPGCTRGSNADLIVQAYRSSTVNAAELTKTIKLKNDVSEDDGMRNGYLLGIRVYRADAFSDTTALKANSVQKAYGATWDRKAPLVEMVTEISGTGDGTFDSLCQRVGGCS